MKYVVISSSSKVPGSCWGAYKRVAVLAVEDGVKPPAYFLDRKGVRVLWIRDHLHVGTSERCAYKRALREANEYAQQLTDSLLRAQEAV